MIGSLGETPPTPQTHTPPQPQSDMQRRTLHCSHKRRLQPEVLTRSHTSNTLAALHASIFIDTLWAQQIRRGLCVCVCVRRKWMEVGLSVFSLSCSPLWCNSAAPEMHYSSWRPVGHTDVCLNANPVVMKSYYTVHWQRRRLLLWIAWTF